MKNLLIGVASGVLIGAGAILGISQIPSVGNAIIKGNNSSSSIENVEKDNQISNLELSNTKLKQDIANLNTQLSETNSQIELKNTQITEKENTINQLTLEKEQLQKINTQLQDVDIKNLTDQKIALEEENKQLKADLDNYAKLVGKDINYLELINELQSELDIKNELLNSATAELEQLRVDKVSLETRVSELESELEKTKQELANYKSLGEIDKLKTSNFDGTWYKDGTFEDYYTIENGVVTHNANEDKGLLNTIYNQMYLMMNTAGGTAVTLSDDGTYFTTADNTVYSTFYINTENTVTPNYLYCGTYANGATQIKLNADNTTTMRDGENTYTGAYLVTTKEKNIGGNITRYNTITATYQTDSDPIVKVFENTSRNNLLDDGETAYSQTEYLKGAILSGSSSTQFNVPTDYCFKVIVRTDKCLTIEPGSYVTLGYSDITSNTYNDMYYINGGIRVGGYSDNVSLYNVSSESIVSNVFELYITDWNYGKYRITNFTSIGRVKSTVVAFEKGTKFNSDSVYGDIYNLYKNSIGLDTVYTIPCQSISDYTTGTYSDDTNTVILSEDTAIINDITSSTYDVTATTDGTDIYQTVTFTYITTEEETDTTHTVVLTFKNKQLQTTKLDDVDLILLRK